MRTDRHFRLAHEPHHFHQMVGLDPHLTLLEKTILTGRYSGILITGKYGTGKSTLARLIYRRYFCLDNNSLERCGKCRGCTEIDGIHSGYDGIIFHGTELNQEAMRKIRSATRFLSWYGNTQAIFIDDLDQAPPAIINQFIHILNIGYDSLIIFTATDLKKLPDPLIQRCTRFMLSYTHVYMADLIRRICKREAIEIADEEAVSELSRRAGHIPRNILNVLDAVAVTTKTLNLETLDTASVYDNTSVHRSIA